MQGLQEALQYVADLARANEKTEVIEICGKTYANRRLERYDLKAKAQPMKAASLSALVDYIANCSGEFPEDRDMIIHIESPKTVRLTSALDNERGRECLFEVEANVSEFRFGKWYDQEAFMIEAQANFQKNEDMELLLKVAGNVEKKNSTAFSDDGVAQVAVMTVGAASKADVIVPNPVRLIPYRTFQEVDQPASNFVFRIGDDDKPTFMIVEAQNQIWKNEAVKNIKLYLQSGLAEMPEEIRNRITIIG